MVDLDSNRVNKEEDQRLTDLFEIVVQDDV